MTTALENWVGILRVWWAVSGMLVLLMQVGFVYLEMGGVKQSDRSGIAIKNLLMLLASTFAYITFGHDLMYGDSVLRVFGWGGNAESYTGVYQAHEWIFLQAGFAAVAATIVSGAIAGRTTLFSNVVIAFVVGGILFPVYGHWVWGSGLLSSGSIEVVDFAGSGTVHFLGGMVALIGALFAGARRWKPSGERPNQRLGYATVGTIFLWIGWIGFNGGSVSPAQLLERQSLAPIGEAVMATTYAACAGGLAVMCLAALWAWRVGDGRDFSLRDCFRQELLFKPFAVLTGVMGGMVAVTANCESIGARYDLATLIGAVGGSAAFLVTKLIEVRVGPSQPRTEARATLNPASKKDEVGREWVDDPVGAVPVHAGAGAAGMLMVGFGHDMADQVLALVLAAAVACSGSAGVFWLLNRYKLLRVTYAREFRGLTFRTMGKRLEDQENLWKNDYGDSILGPMKPQFSRHETPDDVKRFLDKAYQADEGRDAQCFSVVCCAEGEEQALVRKIEEMDEEVRRRTAVIAPDVVKVKTSLKEAGLSEADSGVEVIKLAEGWQYKFVEVVGHMRATENRRASAGKPKYATKSAGASRLWVAVSSIATSFLGTILTGFGVLLAGMLPGLVTGETELPDEFRPATWEIFSADGEDGLSLHIDRDRENWWLFPSAKAAEDAIQGGKIRGTWSTTECGGRLPMEGTLLDFRMGWVYSFTLHPPVDALPAYEPDSAFTLSITPEWRGRPPDKNVPLEWTSSLTCEPSD